MRAMGAQGDPAMTHARTHRLLSELPFDDATSRKLMTRCAACAIVLLVVAVALPPDAKEVDLDRAKAPDYSWHPGSIFTVD
jgi:hypothetical protein